MAVAAKRIISSGLQFPAVRAWQLRSCVPGLGYYLRRYAPCFVRTEQREDARMYIEGLLSDLPRKTAEPIALDHGVNRFRIQKFVGGGIWEHQKGLVELRRHVDQEIGDPDGILIIDPSGFPKKGTESVGVKRQWCGRLGKVENCQLGVFLGYVGYGSATLVDARLYLPADWARSRARREKCHVPQGVRYRTTAQIADERLRLVSPQLRHAWVVGDDEFGRPAWFRRQLARRGERYVLEVPGNTHIRPLEGKIPRGRHKPPFQRVLDWAQGRPTSVWTRIRVGNGENGPLEVDALVTAVQAKNKRKVGPRERLLVTRTRETKPEWKCWLSNATDEVPVDVMACVAAKRHLVEDCFERGKGESGLTHYEVRSWVGWHHHMTLVLIAQWYLTLQQRRIGGKNSRDDGPARGRSRAAIVATQGAFRGAGGGSHHVRPPSYRVHATQ